MKRILCFGDSNTWGYIPGGNGARYPADVRWPGILQKELQPAFLIIEEAQNGRTTVFDDPYEVVCKNGSKHLPIILESQKPLDLVIVMLGTNDLKAYLNQTAHGSAQAAGVLVQRILESDAGPNNTAPKVLLIAPVAIVDGKCPFGHKFDGAPAKSRAMPKAYQEIATEYSVAFLGTAGLAEASAIDCVHLDEAGHASLGKAAAKAVYELLK